MEALKMLSSTSRGDLDEDNWRRFLKENVVNIVELLKDNKIEAPNEKEKHLMIESYCSSFSLSWPAFILNSRNCWSSFCVKILNERKKVKYRHNVQVFPLYKTS